MKPRRNASAPSAPEAGPDWAPRILQRRGVLLRGRATPASEVLCADVHGDAVLLTHLSGPSLRTSPAPCQLQFSDSSGVFQLSGTLCDEAEIQTPSGGRPALRFVVEAGSERRFNRRSAYRVGVTLKGELAVFEPGELDTAGVATADRPGAGDEQARLLALSRLVRARKRPCIVLDLSLGGARVALPEPAPRSGQAALLDLALARGDVVRNLSGTVVQGGRGGRRREFEAHARLHFAAMPVATESRLARLISQIQLKTLRRGVRDRR